MITVKLYTQDNEFLDTYIAQKLSVRRELNAVDIFDFLIDGSALHGDPIDIFERMRVAVDVDGVRQMVGYVDAINRTSDGEFTVQCNSLMWKLTTIRSKSNAKYQDEQVIAILLDLLTYAPGWSLGRITTMQDFLVRTTVDLRGEKRLFAQIIKLVESVPNLFLREGPNQTIELGVFNDFFLPQLRTGDVRNLEVETLFSDMTYQIEAYGGEMTFVTQIDNPDYDPDDLEDPQDEKLDLTTYRSVTLADALAALPSLALDPNFPIVLDKGVHVVRNVRDAAVLDTGDFTEIYDEIVPATRENPTDLEIRQAGYALWLKVVKELEDRSSIQEAWSCDTVTLPEGFGPGDRLYINSTAQRVYYDRFTGRVLFDEGRVSQWFRVPGYRMTYGEEGTEYRLTLTTGLRLVTENQYLKTYELARRRIDPTFSENTLALSDFAVISATIPQGLAADCFNSDSEGFYEGRLVNLPIVDTVPEGATVVTVYGQPFSSSPNASFRVVTLPSLPTSPAVVCVSLNRGWIPTDTLTVHMLVRYT